MPPPSTLPERVMRAPIMGLFSQEAYERHMDARFGSSTWMPRIGAVFLGIVVLVLGGAAIKTLSEQLSLQRLASRWVEVEGRAYTVSVDPIKERSYGKYRIRVDYGYVTTTDDGFVGTSTASLRQLVPVSSGGTVAVLYDPSTPANSMLRIALESRMKVLRAAFLWLCLFAVIPTFALARMVMWLRKRSAAAAKGGAATWSAP